MIRVRLSWHIPESFLVVVAFIKNSFEDLQSAGSLRRLLCAWVGRVGEKNQSKWNVYLGKCLNQKVLEVSIVYRRVEDQLISRMQVYRPSLTKRTRKGPRPKYEPSNIIIFQMERNPRALIQGSTCHQERNRSQGVFYFRIQGRLFRLPTISRTSSDLLSSQ